MKYFVVSDIHSCYTPLKLALKEAGYNKRDKNHTLIILGDIFDRGDETWQVYHFIMSIPKKRRILIKGNHEDLYKELTYATYPLGRDFYNGTVNTFIQLSNLTSDASWYEIRKGATASKATDLIYSKEWEEYYELGDFILVHGSIPRLLDDNGYAKYDPNWRDAPINKWKDARWYFAGQDYKERLFDEIIKEGKTIVCGHYATNYFFQHIFMETNHHDELFVTKNLIALDANTPNTNKVNVLIIENNVAYNSKGEKLEY